MNDIKREAKLNFITTNETFQTIFTEVQQAHHSAWRLTSTRLVETWDVVRAEIIDCLASNVPVRQIFEEEASRDKTIFMVVIFV